MSLPRQCILFCLAGMLVLVSLLPVHGQVIGWRIGTTGVTVGFDGLSMVNEQVGWMSGDLGRILKTTDGGATWTAQTTPVTVYLYSIAFVNENIGYAAGSPTSPGVILKTTNGGVNWTQVGSITGFSFLHAIDCINADTVWVGGTGGFIRTTNGGSTWTTVAQTGTIYQIDFVNSMVGWAVADGGRIFKTTNGGGTWVLQSSGTTQPLHDIHAVNENIAWAVGNLSTVRRTTDGGATWTAITTPIPTTLWAWGVHFANPTTGWISGDQGWVAKTTDGGTSWYRQPVPSSVLAQPLYQIKSVTPEIIVTVGGGGFALWTQNGGDAPIRVISPTSLAYGNVGVGSDSTRIFTVRNTGTMPLTVDSLSSTNVNFTVVGISLPVNVNVGDTLFVPVRFAPVDTGLHSGTIRVVSNDPYNPLGTVSVSGRGMLPVSVEDRDGLLPTVFALDQNYPNPFNPTTTIAYQIAFQVPVHLRIYNMLGEQVKQLVSEFQSAGTYSVVWDGTADDGRVVPSGVYSYQLVAGEYRETRKMVFLK